MLGYCAGYAVSTLQSTTDYVAKTASFLGMPTLAQGAKAYSLSCGIIALPVALPILNYYQGRKTDQAEIQACKIRQQLNVGPKGGLHKIQKELLQEKANEQSEEANKKKIFDKGLMFQALFFSAFSLYMLSGSGIALTAGTAILSGLNTVAGTYLDKALTERRATLLNHAANNINNLK
ncbi:hypothetical protein EOPP23_16340 [Endozoicomonas sp. OPT23]|nr:hypothetical protein [Endozoicomonas sp. OPT23]